MQPLLIDTDPGIDDSIMLSVALASPQLNILGITTVFGNAPIELTTRNALINLEVAGRPQIPVAPGAAGPLLDTPWEWGTHGTDGLGDSHWPNPTLKPLATPGALFLTQHRAKLLAVGPLTNLALALSLQPRLALEEVVIMGGVLRTGLLETNFRRDPPAARRVLASGWPITLVPRDVTQQVPLPSNLSGFLGAISKGRRFMHDFVALAYLLDPTLFTLHEIAVDLLPTGQISPGRLRLRACREVDVPGVLALFQRILLNPSP